MYNLIKSYDPTIIDILNTNIFNIYPIPYWSSRGIVELIKLTIIFISYICHYWNYTIVCYDTLILFFIECCYEIFMSFVFYKNF